MSINAVNHKSIAFFIVENMVQQMVIMMKSNVLFDNKVLLKDVEESSTETNLHARDDTSR